MFSEREKSEYKFLAFAALFIFAAVFLSSCSEETVVSVDKNAYPIAISSIEPKEFSAGDTITVRGFNFGVERGNKKIVFRGEDPSSDGYAEASEYVFWSDSLVKLVAPEGCETGYVIVQEQLSSALPFEMKVSTFKYLIELFVQLSLGVTVIFIYLQINKIWKRKHEKEVAEAQSLTGLFIYILNCVLWVLYYVFVEEDINSTIDTSIYIFQGSVLFIIGTGIFVKGQQKESIWVLIKRALKLERKEADYLLKKWFKPQNAEKILGILYQIAMIDKDYDPKEEELIKAFAKEWNIEYDPKKIEKEIGHEKENSYIKLRKSLESYLESEPPEEQVAQLKDMITAMVEADEKVTEEEELISSELIPMIENYLKQEKDVQEYKVLIVPQKDEQEAEIRKMFPNAKKIRASGGEAFEIGSYYSSKYAEMVCDQYRKLKFFTIAHSPKTIEIS